MLRGLQTGFGALIGADLLSALRGRGVQLVRCDCQGVYTREKLAALASEVVLSGLRPMLIIRPDHAAILPTGGGIDVELRNEPDIGTDPCPRLSPESYARDVQFAYATLPAGYRLWAGSISNLNARALAWLMDSIRYWPEAVGVSVHRYPPKGAPPTVPHDGFASRQAEVDALKAVIGARPWCVSEFGFHTAEWVTGWWWWKKRYHWTDEQIAAFVGWEWAFWEYSGATAAVLYQINDGGTNVPLDRFGIRHTDGTWKPVAHTFAAAR